MGKIRIRHGLLLLVMVSLLCGPVQAHGQAGLPSLALRAGMGGSFRTVDATVTLAGDGAFTRLYYLALTRGSVPPSVKTIAEYMTGAKTAGLTDGSVVRGQWMMSPAVRSMTFSLRGGENVNRLPEETGFIDGYRYDLYALAIRADGVCSLAAVARDVMAQPFAGMSADGTTFTVETVRQLENIQRLAEVSVATRGVHGSWDFLTSPAYTYVLGNDLDLNRADDTRFNETGWVPIGHVDANPKFIFRGSFDGQGHTLRHWVMDKDTAADGQSYETQGIFGKTENATLRNLTIEAARIRVVGNFGQPAFAVGVLAGETVGGTVDHVTVTGSQLTAFGSDAGHGYVGGVIGKATGTHLYNLTVKHSTVTGFDEKKPDGYARAIGGVVGYYAASGGDGLLNFLESAATVKAPPAAPGAPEALCVGGVLGLLENSSADAVVRAEGWYATGNVTGGDRTGGLAGQVIDPGEEAARASSAAASSAQEGTPADPSAQARFVFDAGRFAGRVSGYGMTGGLFGEARSALIKNADAGGYVQALRTDIPTGAAGGLAGSLTSCAVRNSLARGARVAAGQNAAGGLVGTAADSTFYQSYVRRGVEGGDGVGGFAGVAAGCAFQSCGVEPGTVAGARNTGGFVGQVSAQGRWQDCRTLATVKGTAAVGGFVGMARGEVLNANAGHLVSFWQCAAAGAVTAREGQAGGFAGVLAYTSAGSCRAEGAVRANAPEAGGFCGRLTHLSRVANACASGDVVNTDAMTGGFAGLITNASCVEYAYAAGNVTGYDDTGGFVGAVAAYGAPNTLTDCLSFAQWVSAPSDMRVRRFAGRLDHEGVNNCYAYLGGMVVSGRQYGSVISSPYGADAADMNGDGIRQVLARLGWDEAYWQLSDDGTPPVLRENF